MVYLFERQDDTGIQREIDVPSVDLLINQLHCPGPARLKPEAESFIHFRHGFESFAAAFPDKISIHLGCQCQRLQLNPLCRDASPNPYNVIAIKLIIPFTI